MKKLTLIIMLSGMLACASTQAVETSGTPGPETETRQQRKARERAEKAEELKNYIDSLVVSESFIFRPYSYQLQPAGRNRRIVNSSYVMDVYPEYIDLYLPYYSGIYPPYKAVLLNYNLNYIPDYKSVNKDGRWTVTFTSSLYSSDTYYFKLEITPHTADAELEISSHYGQRVRYSGSILGHF